MTVGRSWRTPAKHDLMRNLIGKEVGVVSSKPEILRSVWYDLTSGDGAPTDGEEWVRGCSPGILAYHASRAAKPVIIIAYEIKPNTYDRLVANLAEHLPSLGYARADDGIWLLGSRVRFHAICASGAGADIEGVRRGDAVFALNDPNAITEWAMRPTFAAELAGRTPWYRSLSTLGCNPGGLKRLDVEERLKWFQLLADQERAQPQHRDFLLAAIERDDAQWAYLMSEPVKWRPAMEVTARSSFKRFQLQIRTAWWRTESPAYLALKDHLFLTKAERAA